jgi:uncharacterized protein
VDSRDLSSVTRRLEEALALPSRSLAGSDHQANIRSLHGQIEAIARGDIDAFLTHAHDDATLDIFAPPELPWIRHAQGAAELRRALEQNFGSVEEQSPELTNVIADGDTVVLFGRERGRIRSTGQRYDVEFVERFTFRNDRLAAIRIIAAYAPPGSSP